MITGSYNADTKTLSVTFRGETREFTRLHDAGNWVCAFAVFGGKFRSGNKVWPMDVTFWKDSGRCNVNQGGYSNKGGACGIVGWYNPDSAYNTQHKGAR